ncbi:ABC transporter permease [Streptomyces sp. CWNU-52B]|uniref:ABC transporter permease n=1 Tax=unclassified Streptomyces TaxID=2593676 RepID=UPI0039C0AB31
MISHNCLNITGRILQELRRDYRTLFLFTISPAFVMVLCAGLMGGYPESFNRTGLLVAGLFPTAPAFLFAAFAMQRERYRGSLEFLLSAPVTRLDVLIGYVLAFSVPALAQITLTLSVSYGLLGLDTAGPIWAVAVMALLSCVLGVVLGLFVVNLAHDELQLTKVLPAIALPHLMVAGLFRPYDDMTGWMQVLATIAPWHYAIAAIEGLQTHSSLTSATIVNASVTVALIVLLSALCVPTLLRRRTA